MRIALLACLAVVCLAKGHDEDWGIRKQETLQQSFPVNGQSVKLMVNNLNGRIHIVGVAGSEVRVNAVETIRAENDAALNQARQVKLEMTQDQEGIRVRYQTPHNDNDSDHDHRHYSVSFDIDVEAPPSTTLDVSDVNGGINIEKTTADYKVKDVNGGIHMTDIAGAGSVEDMNGALAIHFAQNPQAPCHFKSFNGSVDVWFQPSLSADLLFKTFNGHVYSEFDVSGRAVPASVTTERRDGKFVYKSNGISSARAGNGGPELSFETFNGSIRLRTQK